MCSMLDLTFPILIHYWDMQVIIAVSQFFFLIQRQTVDLIYPVLLD
ncbi:hypothetical protein AB205_0123730 [Aquarana catesbeiana]|uniref:Uncharacterized protein n=1 Tax=Aquarana catesbeiana TaxID=8400 RepID=A0A2G9S9N1_AQUCT|nr:hypothetical protein AB205_0123730 [Aquarana catesbeiana]